MKNIFFPKSIILSVIIAVSANVICCAQDYLTNQVVEDRLAALKLSLPTVSAPVANYVSCTQVGKLIFVSGQLPIEAGKVKYVGRLGSSISDEVGAEAAKLCALNVLAQLKATIGSFDYVKGCIKLTGFINSTPEYTAHSKVMNGASDIIVGALGNQGKHARAAVGVTSLPLGAAVEVEAIFEIE